MKRTLHITKYNYMAIDKETYLSFLLPKRPYFSEAVRFVYEINHVVKQREGKDDDRGCSGWIIYTE